MRWPWQKKAESPAITRANETIEEASKATDEAAKAVRDYWMARTPPRDYAYAERRRLERRHK